MYADGFGVGTQTFISQDAEYLSKKHDLLFVCTTLNDPHITPSGGVKVIKFKHTFLLKKLWHYDIYLSYQNNHFCRQLNKIIDDFEPDLIHCQFGIESLKLIDNIYDKTIPIVIQFRGYDASRMLNKKSYVSRLKDILKRDNYYSIFVAESLKRNLEKHSINVENSMILHSGINLSKFVRGTDKKHDGIIFLQVSSLSLKKGHEYTLKAFAKFLSFQKSKKFILIFTGDGQRKEELIQLSKKLRIENNVVFVGFVSPEKAMELMDNADVFVHHSITPENGDEEGIPNALIEAMAMELPVLSTYHAGIPELVMDGVNGYLVKEKDIDTYALRMADIIHWNKIKENREAVVKEFEIEKHIEKLESFYLHIISSVKHAKKISS
jgi:glycosyltransferase involved in cell wall biosynthesis